MRVLWIFLICLLYQLSFAQTGNPFEVYRGDSDFIEPTTALELIQDTADVLIDADAISDSIPVQQIPNVYSATNPFNVDDHRPIAIELDSITGEPVKQTPTSVPNENVSHSFLLWFFMLSLILITLAISLKRKTFNNFYRVVLNQNYLKMVSRDENGGNSVFILIQYVGYFVNTAILIYLLAKEQMGGLVNYMWILGFVILIYIIRHISMYLLKTLTSIEELIVEYNFSIIAFSILCSLIILPFLVLAHYTNAAKLCLYSALIIFIGFYICRQVRGFLLALTSRHTTLFHFFIYLCAFEIAPILIFLKLFANQSINMHF